MKFYHKSTTLFWMSQLEIFPFKMFQVSVKKLIATSMLILQAHSPSLGTVGDGQAVAATPDLYTGVER